MVVSGIFLFQPEIDFVYMTSDLYVHTIYWEDWASGQMGPTVLFQLIEK